MSTHTSDPIDARVGDWVEVDYDLPEAEWEPRPDIDGPVIWKPNGRAYRYIGLDSPG